MTNYSVSEIRATAKDNGLVFRQVDSCINGKQCYALFARGTTDKRSDDAPLWWWSNELEHGSFSNYAD